jgi:hypothetical protein
MGGGPRAHRQVRPGTAYQPQTAPQWHHLTISKFQANLSFNRHFEAVISLEERT